MIVSEKDALDLLRRLGAPKQLIVHLNLVGEAGRDLAAALDDMNVQFDRRFVETGIAFHDAGKIRYPDELIQGGNQHEAAGEALLLEQGVDPKLARCCRSHAQYDALGVSFEELVIALADKLWKGKREPELELRVIDGVAERLSLDRWGVFEQLDNRFESIAAQGDERLSRSVQ